MDHAQAWIIDYETWNKEIIQSEATGHQRFDGEGSDGIRLGNYRSSNNEDHKHNREQNLMRHYYKAIAEKLKNYEEILITGPTQAASEFRNFYAENHLLQGKKITIEKSDYVSENELLSKIKNHFNQR